MDRDASPETFFIEFFKMIGWLLASIIGLLAILFSFLLSFFQREQQLHSERKARENASAERSDVHPERAIDVQDRGRRMNGGGEHGRLRGSF
jgi:hypothetical protein